MYVCVSCLCLVPKKDRFGLELWMVVSLHVGEGINPVFSARQVDDLHY